jgi:hypothetical protein
LILRSQKIGSRFGSKFSSRWTGSFIVTFSLTSNFISFYSCYSRPPTKAHLLNYLY